MRRPPEAVELKRSLWDCLDLPSDAPVSVGTHLSPHGSDLAARSGPGFQGDAEAVDEARLRQTVGSANGMAMGGWHAGGGCGFASGYQVGW